MVKKSLLIAALCVSSSAANAGVAEGVNAYQGRNYALAFKEFRGVAWEGNQVTQFYMGLMYSLGQGVAKDEKEAAIWYEKSARQGYPGAQVNLGNLYVTGAGVPHTDANRTSDKDPSGRGFAPRYICRNCSAYTRLTTSSSLRCFNRSA